MLPAVQVINDSLKCLSHYSLPVKSSWNLREVYLKVSMVFCVTLYLMSTNGVQSRWHCFLIWVKILNNEITDKVIAFNWTNVQNLSLQKIPSQPISLYDKRFKSELWCNLQLGMIQANLSKIILTKLHALTPGALVHINGSTKGTSFASKNSTTEGHRQVHILALMAGYRRIN